MHIEVVGKRLVMCFPRSIICFSSKTKKSHLNELLSTSGKGEFSFMWYRISFPILDIVLHNLMLLLSPLGWLYHIENHLWIPTFQLQLLTSPVWSSLLHESRPNGLASYTEKNYVKWSISLNLWESLLIHLSQYFWKISYHLPHLLIEQLLK